ncbi:MAG: helix-turn-helix transcriptional regulator [Oscillospiraceae bacterium]|jgi:DNA-binding CsgD family transcriptional regulator|nr:helix-turn-helix transcriptional regulator [Oscillospiraceae bacterium]
MLLDGYGGEYLEYELDWQAGEMRLSEASQFLLNSLLKINPKRTLPLTPWVFALEAYANTDQIESREGRHTYLIDMTYDHKKLSFRLRPSNDFRSVVNVTKEQVARLFHRKLTQREIEVAFFLFKGDTFKAIASELGVAEGTIKRSAYNLYQKLGVTSQVGLMREIYARLAEEQMKLEKENKNSGGGGVNPITHDIKW